MDYTVITYLMYALISIGLIMWVGKTLFINGRVFLIKVFEEDEMADSVNKLLLVGFYLINIGYMVYNLKIYKIVDNLRVSIETLSVKIGVIILILGVMHFFNIFVLFKLKRSKHQNLQPSESK